MEKKGSSIKLKLILVKLKIKIIKQKRKLLEFRNKREELIKTKELINEIITTEEKEIENKIKAKSQTETKTQDVIEINDIDVDSQIEAQVNRKNKTSLLTNLFIDKTIDDILQDTKIDVLEKNIEDMEIKPKTESEIEQEEATEEVKEIKGPAIEEIEENIEIIQPKKVKEIKKKRKYKEFITPKQKEKIKMILNKIGIFLKEKFNKLFRITKIILKRTKRSLKKDLKPDFSNLKNKFKRTFTVVCTILFVWFLTFLAFYYFNSDENLTKKYKLEIADLLENENIIVSIKKEDINYDNILDYIIISKNDDVAENLVSVIYINGDTKDFKKIDTNLSFGNDLKFEIKESKNQKYIFIFSKLTSNSSLITLNSDENLISILDESFGKVPNGYLISYRKDEDTNELIVTLDNKGVEYLSQLKDEYRISLNETNIDLNMYRTTYSREKFNYFEFYDIDGDLELEFVGVEYVLYLNKTSEELQKTFGKVKVIFNLDENKLEFNQVLVGK